MFGNKLFYAVCFIFIYVPCFAAVPQAGSILQMGVANSTSTSNASLITPAGGKNAITLIASVSSGTNGNYTMLVALGPSGGGQYQVPAGKELVCNGDHFFTNTNGDAYINFGYGTAALVANDTGTAPTGKLCYSSDSTCGTAPATYQGGNIVHSVASAGTALNSTAFALRFPASSYPFVRGGGSSWASAAVNLQLDCAEE